MKNKKFPPRMVLRGGPCRLLRNVLFLILGLGAASALGEHFLEFRDTARLTSGETFYNVQGRRIRYHQTGPGAHGPTVILLNGIAGSLEQWDEVQSALGKTLPVLAYDRSGTGFSDPAERHDAYAESAELAGLLGAPHVGGPPYIMIGYSSSAMLAIVFAALHRDIVAGIVLVDPILRKENASWSYWRIFLRPSVANPVKAFFGYTRLKLVIQNRNAPPMSPKEERWRAIIESTHHWVAATHDALGLDQSADEADAAMADRRFAELPVGEIVTDPPNEAFIEAQKKFVAGSTHSVMRAVPYEHTLLLTEPRAVAALVDVVHEVAAAGRPASSP